jgi:hypothetical protein
MPYGKPPRQLERGRSNRFLAALPPHDFALLAPHLRTVTFERGTILHDAADEIERVYFPHTGMVSLVAVMQSGAAVETAFLGTIGMDWTYAGVGPVADDSSQNLLLRNTSGDLESYTIKNNAIVDPKHVVKIVLGDQRAAASDIVVAEQSAAAAYENLLGDSEAVDAWRHLISRKSARHSDRAAGREHTLPRRIEADVADALV